MISLEEIEKTIMDLERRDTTYAVCERLAWLYIVRDHLTVGPAHGVAFASEPAPATAGTDFLNAVSGKPIDGVLRIMGAHMECVRVLYPKEYEVVVIKISEL